MNDFNDFLNEVYKYADKKNKKEIAYIVSSIMFIYNEGVSYNEVLKQIKNFIKNLSKNGKKINPFY